MTEGSQNWHRAAELHEIDEGQGHFVQLLGHELALFRIGDRAFCLEDSCPHRGGSLADGAVEDGAVICPWHSWRYRVEDGECESLPTSQPAECFPVKIEDGAVFVQLKG